MLGEIVSLLAGESLNASSAQMRGALRVLHGLETDESALAWAVHPLGFFHARRVLDDKRQLRFHVWPDGWRIPPDQVAAEIHDHIFDLNSLILRGTMRNETFDAWRNSPHTHRLVRVRYGGTASAVDGPEEPIKLSVVNDERHEASRIYRLPAGTLHRAAPALTPTITVVLATTGDQERSPRVAVELGASLPGPFERRPLNPNEQAKLAAALAGAG